MVIKKMRVNICNIVLFWKKWHGMAFLEKEEPAGWSFVWRKNRINIKNIVSCKKNNYQEECMSEFESLSKMFE